MSLLAALLLIALLAGGCSDRSSSGRVIVLGLDGFDPDTVQLLVAEGKLPNLAKLGREGASGRLRSMEPMLSPILWTTIATGREPIDHGISHFVAVNHKTGTEIPVTSRMRRVKALWNILSDQGKTADVVGWWATWPAEPIHGAIVSDHTSYHFLFEDGFSDATGRNTTGLVYPPELWSKIIPLVRRPSDISFEEAKDFVTVGREEFYQPFAFKDDLAQFRWALASADSYSSIGRYLLHEQRPDLLMVYIEGTDSVSHLFGHLFRAGPLRGDLADQQRRFGKTVEQMYVYADRIVGDYMNALDPDGALVVLSDHGFHLGELEDDPTKAHDFRRVSASSHRAEGVLYFYGHGVRAGAAIARPTLLDIAPTILEMTGLAASSDMPGRVLREALLYPQGPPRVGSYEIATAKHPSDDAGSSAADAAILEHLQSLGYLDASSPSGDKNQAAMYFEAGQYERAAATFERLIEQHPDDAALRIGLAGAFGAIGKFDEALRCLDEAEQLDPLRPEIYQNRGAVLERQGRSSEAAAEYAQALKYKPEYAPSRDALARLTGAATPRAPVGKAEREAFALAQEAQAETKRGEYSAAWAKLEDAVRTAPDYVLVHQYRANVAYLRGDYRQATRSLERALELEPNNALYRKNLEKLRTERERGVRRE